VIKVANISKISAFKTYGESMFPLLWDGDVVYLAKKRFDRIAVNDIVCVRKGLPAGRQGDRIFTHRVVYKTDKYLITKGENNQTSDGKIYPKNVIGVVYKIKRGRNEFSIDDLYLIQSTLYFGEIVKVKRTLEKTGIKFVFLKGLPLHLYHEGKHPRRIYADCDILISPKFFSRAKTILRKLGFKEFDSSLSETLGRLKNKSPEVNFLKIVKGFPIFFDIHLEVVFMMTQLGELNALYPQSLLNSLSGKFLREKRDVSVWSHKFPILSSENLLIYLALHLYHHNFKGAYRYDFMKSIISKEQQNFSKIAKLAKEYKLMNFIYPVFLILQKYYGLNFDRDFLNDIRPDSSFARVRKMLYKLNIFDEEQRINSGIERFKNLFYLSPEPFFRKVMVFLDKQVIYTIIWVFLNRVKSIKMVR